MMSILKRSALIMLLALGSFGLYGCSTTDTTSEEPQAFTGQTQERERSTYRARPHGLGGKSIHQYTAR